MLFSRFLREERGSIMPLFAISLVPIITLAGASVDFTNMSRARSKLQNAVDLTALAVNHDLHLSSAQGNIQTKARGYFNGEAGELENPVLAPVTYNLAQGSVDVSATAIFTPTVLNVVGYGPLTLHAKARTVVGDQEIEVALVLDNSGSMAGTKIESLRTAAKDLVTKLYQSASATTRVKMGIVPFSGAVNVGATNKTADWMDKNALSPAHSENFASAKNRFTLFDEMKSVSWAGCVESRAGEHAVNDTLPDTSDPASLFVPMFAPDEPDEDDENNKEFINNYLKDNGVDSNCTSSQKSDTSDAGRQKRICKYKGQTPSTRSTGSTNKGPNFWCNSDPILPLTGTKQTLIDAIDDMDAKGYTNIHEGLMWGWRVLSKQAPFTDGKAYGTPNLRKYIVLMTDGANTINGNSDTHNNSDYSAYGYASNNRLAEDSDDMSAGELKSAMDDRLEEACENAKNGDPDHPEKITIYTIAFRISDTATLNRLKDCASSPGKAKKADDEEELEATFASIAQELGKLRITE